MILIYIDIDIKNIEGLFGRNKEASREEQISVVRGKCKSSTRAYTCEKSHSKTHYFTCQLKVIGFFN